MQRRRVRKRLSRRGAAVVEFALVAPVLLLLVLGMTETARVLDVQDKLATATRQGARLAAMDREGLLAEGQTTNEKVIEDIRNFLDSVGLPGDDAEVTIAAVDDRDTPFDLDDPDNNLELFQVYLELPYSAANPYCFPGTGDFTFGSRIVFRNARATIVH